MIFVTDRLILRPWEDTDAESLYKYAKDPNVGPAAGWPVHTSVENSLEIIRTVLSEPKTWAICLKEDNVAIGSIGLFKSKNKDAVDNELEVGYWIGVPFWGKGYVPEAVKEMQRHCFEDLDCTAMWCAHNVINEKSRKCQEKVGFRYHHIEEANYNALMDDYRDYRFTYFTKMEWEIRECTDKLIRNQLEECQWNNKLLLPTDLETFGKFLKDRSKAIREYYAQNEQYISTIRSYYKQPLDRVTADALFESARAMVLTGRLDPGMIIELGDVLVDYFRESGDEEIAIIIGTIRNSTFMDYYNRMRPGHRMDKISESMRWIISNKDKICEYKDMRARRNIFNTYSGLTSYLIQDSEAIDISEALALHEDENELWNRPEVRACLGDDTYISAKVDELNYTMPMQIALATIGNDDVMDAEKKMAREYYESHKDLDDWVNKNICRLMAIKIREFDEEITHRQAADEFYKLWKEIPEPDWKGDINNAEGIFHVLGYTFMGAMKILEVGVDDREYAENMTIDMLGSFSKIAEDLPFEFLTSYVNDVFRGYFEAAMPNLTRMDFKEKMLNELLIYRQPSTFLHAQMVEKISQVITKELLEKTPDIFTSLPMYDSVEEVLEHREALLDIVARGARMHDTGKCSIASVIMQQSRRINDDEFGCIKAHPEMGKAFFKDDPNFEIYTEIMIGHHKTYDGKGGYPADFDNTKSPYRVLIDIISISDATDAATDTLGRNYTPGKDFRTLLEELKSGAGIKYNPYIVKVMSESDSLIEKLTAITGPERVERCYKAYKKCTGK